jgi:hypothetical protein
MAGSVKFFFTAQNKLGFGTSRGLLGIETGQVDIFSVTILFQLLVQPIPPKGKKKRQC